MRDARGLTTTCPRRSEKLLADYVDAERRKREEREDLIDATSEMAKAHDAEHVLWGQAFSTL